MILYLNCNDNPVTFNKKNYLLRAAQRLGLDYVLDIKDERPTEPEYVLNIEPFNFVKGSVWTGVWLIDMLVDTNDKCRDEPSCNRLYFANTSKQFPIKDQRKLLYQAADPELHHRFKEGTYDFIHSGSSGKEVRGKRDQAIARLREAFSFQDFGNGHPPEEYVKYLNEAKIQFVQSMDVNGEEEVAQRFFECLAIGPVLTNYAPDLEDLGLIEGVDYFYYKTEREMMRKMRRLVNDPSLAATMAEAGRRKALLYHTYEHRLATILEDIRESTH